jgi:hypothetical protein
MGRRRGIIRRRRRLWRSGRLASRGRGRVMDAANEKVFARLAAEHRAELAKEHKSRSGEGAWAGDCESFEKWKNRREEWSESMNAKMDNLITVLDAGSSKSCVLVAELIDGVLRYRGHGVEVSRGMRRGVISDLGRRRRRSTRRL